MFNLLQDVVIHQWLSSSFHALQPAFCLGSCDGLPVVLRIARVFGLMAPHFNTKPQSYIQLKQRNTVEFVGFLTKTGGMKTCSSVHRNLPGSTRSCSPNIPRRLPRCTESALRRSTTWAKYHFTTRHMKPPAFFPPPNTINDIFSRPRPLLERRINGPITHFRPLFFPWASHIISVHCQIAYCDRISLQQSCQSR